jgi:hypothetical protein
MERARAASDGWAEQTAVPDGVAYEPADADGVAAEWAIPAGADRSRVLLYLHGGGYSLGSIASHRRPVGHVAKVAGISGCSLAYRLAPEHPFPAGLGDAVTAFRWPRALSPRDRWGLLGGWLGPRDHARTSSERPAVAGRSGAAVSMDRSRIDRPVAGRPDRQGVRTANSPVRGGSRRDRPTALAPLRRLLRLLANGRARGRSRAVARRLDASRGACVSGRM